MDERNVIEGTPRAAASGHAIVRAQGITAKSPVYRLDLSGRAVRFIGGPGRSSSLWIPVDDFTQALTAALPHLPSAVWSRIAHRRLLRVEVAAKQRAFIDGRLHPTIDSRAAIAICQSLGRISRRIGSSDNCERRYATFRDAFYRCLFSARSAMAARRRGI